jgi:sugar/nucleoside kinase (ribokinase family)
MCTSYRVLGIANPFYDRPADVDEAFLARYSLPEGSTQVRDRSEVIQSYAEAPGKKLWTLGGSATKAINVTSHLSPQGTCALYGKIGDDDMGTEVKAAIERNGIFSLHTKGTKGTPLANCFISNNTRTMMADAGAAAEISAEEIQSKIALFHGVEFTYVEGYLAFFGETLQASVACAQEAHVPNTALCLPSYNVVELFKPKFKEAAAVANYIFGNGKEIMELTGESTVQKALGCFESSKTIFATVNSEGCWVRERGKSDPVLIPTKPVPKVVNPVGAGDTFAGAALAALLKGLPPSEAASWGNRTAGEVIQQPSATLSPDQWRDLRIELRA